MHNKLCYIFYSLVIILLTGCSSNKGFDSWLGNYTFSEKPVKALAGYSMVMEWDLSVNKIDKNYSAILNVNGQQTGFSLFNNVAGNDSSLFIIYESTLGGAGNVFKSGDTLFSLHKKGAYIKTHWGMLAPILSETAPKEGRCFIFTGTDINNNTIRLPKYSDPLGRFFNP
jgi:hypothetical protein